MAVKRVVNPIHCYSIFKEHESPFRVPVFSPLNINSDTNRKKRNTSQKCIFSFFSKMKKEGHDSESTVMSLDSNAHHICCYVNLIGMENKLP